MDDSGEAGPYPVPEIRRAVSRARAALAWERLWPRLVPPLSLAGLFLILSWLGLWRYLGDWPRLALLAALGAAFAATLLRAALIARPSHHEAELRVEAASRLRHHPVLGLSDTLSPVADDPEAVALWQAHRRRLLASLSQIRAGPPRPDLVRRDPNALRFAVPVLLFVAFAVGWGEWGLRLGEAFRPASELASVPAGARIDAWIDPPAYTRAPPVFLSRRDASATEPVMVPQGSRLTIRIVSDQPARVALDDSPVEPAGETRDVAGGGESIRTYSATLERDIVASIEHGGAQLSYPVSVTEDRPPTVVRGPAEVNRAGTFSLDFEVADDYGVTGGTVTFRPKEPPAEDARPLVEPPQLPMRIARGEGGKGAGRVDARLESHPYAGLDVLAETIVQDAAGQEGRPADPGEMALPKRPFTNPIARALVEQRQVLALDAGHKPKVAFALDALAIAPAEFIRDDGLYLALRVAYYRLLDARTDDELRDYLDFLWDLARGIEDGDMSTAEKRLQEAREKLQDALENGASEEEIAELMQELRAAMQEFLQSYMERMAEQGLQNLPMMPSQDMQSLSQQDIDRMLDRIEDLARLGERDAAQQLLGELQQMLDNLQMAQRGQMQQGDSEMMQQLDELARLMQEQQRLMDETFQLDQGQRPGQRGENGDGQPLTQEELAEFMRRMQKGQGDLRDSLQALLDQLRQGQEGQGGEPGQGEAQQGEGQDGQGSAGERALGRAGRSMGQAERSLGRGESGLAYGQQGQALEALREGMQGLMQEMMAQQQQGMGQGRQVGRGQPGGRTDPLGRPQRNEGPDLGQNVRVPDEIDVERARRILKAIRDRLGERYRPGFELDYLERLIRPE